MKKPAAASVRSASPARTRKLKLIEPFHIIRERRMRRERIRRFALGFSLVAILMLGIGAILMLGIGAIGGCAEARPRGAGLAMGGPVLAPMGAFDFCTRHKAECEAPERVELVALDAAAFALLVRVNDAVNALPQFPDEAAGRANFWRLAGEAGGDCEDLALEKRRRLREAGLPSSALLVATAEAWTGEPHALLLVMTDRGAYALDNLDPLIRKAEDTGYLFRAVMSPENPRRWVDGGAGTAPPLVTASTGTQAKDPRP